MKQCLGTFAVAERISASGTRFIAPQGELRISTVINLSRRRFIGICSALGTGLVLGLRLPAKGEKPPPSNSLFQPNAFVRIDRRGKVTLMFAKSEMGQGIHTALPMLIAEELEVDWAAISVERDGLNRAYGEQITGGSSSVITAWEPLRKAGRQLARC